GQTIPSDYINVAQVSDADQWDPDSTPNNDDGDQSEDEEDAVTVEPQFVDVSLVKSVSNATPNVGDTVTFTLLLTNAGPAAATNITVADLVPSGFTYVVGSIAGGTSRSQATPTTGNGLIWTVASLASGANTSLTFQAVVLLSGTHTNYAQVTTTTQYDIDSTPGNGQQAPDEDDDSSVSVAPITGDVTGHLYYDHNGDGTQDLDGLDNLPGTGDDEVDLANVDVVITPSIGPAFTVTTDANGDWLATVPPGATTSNVVETDTCFTAIVPSGWIQTEGTDPTTVTAIAYTTVSGGIDGYFAPRGAIGNRVWLDENGDGVQDAGEAGIPQLTVTLTGDANGDGVADTLTTVTDQDGSYVFSNLYPGVYTITVSPTAGLNPTFDYDGLGTTNTTSVTIAGGQRFLDADFGYNWTPPGDSPNPPSGATGAIGDRLWIDVDGDGVQDPGEAGLSGVAVQLYRDANNDGVYETLVATTTSSPAGNYIFDGLAADDYQVVVNGGATPTGYTLNALGDPDGSPDNMFKVLLAPGDVFVNADFGYRPQAGATGAIGDRVWLDADADGMQDVGEP
ncbi:MAG TPA: SdrD B-like domain-containing protein, partial [Pirellulaceae bacterium]|nr:SdrD B-like domain-containing protein [Pirellulaceae bacterium]